MNNFIIFEGPDFCGKTTIMNKIRDEHSSADYFYSTREPGSFLEPSNEECEKYRTMLLEEEHTPEEEAILFSKSRYIHTIDIIKYLNTCNVLCDRYIVSSLAYQGYAQGLGKDVIHDLNKDTLDLLKENNVKMHILKFNISEEEWLKRKTQRLETSETDTIEDKNLDTKIMDFFSTRYIYEHYTDSLDANHYDIDANTSIDDLYKNVINIINNI